MLKGFLPKKEPLVQCRKLEERDLQPVTEEVVTDLLMEFELSQQKLSLFHSLCKRMSASKLWQVRLRYTYILYRLTVDLDQYELTAQHRVDGFTDNLENIRGRMPTSIKNYHSSSALERRINQYIVEPFYNYCLRLAFNSELRKMDVNCGCYPTTLQMFKLINLINLLFEFKEPCRFMLASFMNVFIIEQLVVTIYEEIQLLYGKLKAGLEFRVSHSSNESGSGLAELEVLLTEGQSTYKRIAEFQLLFGGFSRPLEVELPKKPQLDRTKLRQLRTNERLYELASLKSMKSKRSMSSHTTNFISKFNSRTVYEEDASNIYENSRIEEETVENKPHRRRWIEDESQMYPDARLEERAASDDDAD